MDFLKLIAPGLVGLVIWAIQEGWKRLHAKEDKRDEQDATVTIAEMNLSDKQLSDAYERYKTQVAKSEENFTRATSCEAREIVLHGEIERLKMERDTWKEEAQKARHERDDLMLRVRELEGKPVKRVRILVVDDEDDGRDLMALFLEKLGYEWEPATSGAQALLLVESARRAGHAFDLVLLDQSMGEGLTGDAAAAMMQAAGQFVKIVFVSGHATARPGFPGEFLLKGKTARELGALAIWQRPLDYDALPRMIDEVLKR